METWALVTGGGTGLGRALALALADRGLQVLIAGRRSGPLEETRSEAPARIHTVAADVSTEAGRAAIAAALPGEAQLRYLVHNAGVLEPVGPLAEVSLDAWRRHMAINLEGPLFLTQTLLPRLRGGRLLHVSSGAAHHAYPGWGAYCTSKAALHMIYQTLREELRSQGVCVGSVRPGVVDTPMQSLVRGFPAEQFPAVERFRRLKAEGELLPPEDAAAFIVRLLMDVDDVAFSESEWDVRDHIG